VKSSDSETASVVTPTLKALNALPYVVAERLHAGRVKNGKMRLASAGSPDIVSCIAGVTVFFEGKTAIGRLSQAQIKWHERARNAGAFVQVIRSPAEAVEVAKALFGKGRT
jgi:hypothetical protein